MDVNNILKFLSGINEVSPNKSTIKKIHAQITDLFRGPLKEKDGDILVKCILKYIDFVTKIASTKSFKDQMKICKRSYVLITNIISSQMQEIFLRTATKRVFDIIIDDDVQSWCIKKELLKFFISCIKNTDKSLRQNTVQELPDFYLFKLMDTVSTYGDFDFQLLLIESVFRMYGRNKIAEKLKDLIPESEELSESFAAISGDTFDEDVRKFLNLLNAKSGKVFSIVSKNVHLGNLMCEKPLDGVDGLWVDFNLSEDIISWYSSRSSFVSRSNDSDSFSETDDRAWNLITVFEHDVESVQVHRPGRKDVILILIKLNEPCLSSFDDTQAIVGAADNIKLVVPCNMDKTVTLLTKVLPSMFKNKYSHSSGKVSTNKKVYKPINVTLSRKGKTEATRSKSDTFSPLTIFDTTNGSRSDINSSIREMSFRKTITISSTSTSKCEVISIPDSSAHSTNASFDLLAADKTEEVQQNTEFETALTSPVIHTERKVSKEIPSVVLEIPSININRSDKFSDSDMLEIRSNRQDISNQSVDTLKSTSTRLSSQVFLDNELCTVQDDINHIQILSGRCSGSNVRYSQKSGRSSKTTSTPRKLSDSEGKTDTDVTHVKIPDKQPQSSSSGNFETANRFSGRSNPSSTPRKLSNNEIKTDVQTTNKYSQISAVIASSKSKKPPDNEIKTDIVNDTKEKQQSSSPGHFETADYSQATISLSIDSQNSSDDSQSSMRVNIFKYKDAVLSVSKKSARNKFQGSVSEYFKPSSRSVSPDKKASNETSDAVSKNDDAIIVISEDFIKPTEDLFQSDEETRKENQKLKQPNEGLENKCKEASEELIDSVTVTKESSVKAKIGNNRKPLKVTVTEASNDVSKDEAIKTASSLGDHGPEASKIKVNNAACVVRDTGSNKNKVLEEEHPELSIVNEEISEDAPATLSPKLQKNVNSVKSITKIDKKCKEKHEASKLKANNAVCMVRDTGFNKNKVLEEENPELSIVNEEISEDGPASTLSPRLQKIGNSVKSITKTNKNCKEKHEASKLKANNAVCMVRDTGFNKNKILEEENPVLSIVNEEISEDAPASTLSPKLQKTGNTVKSITNKKCKEKHQAVLDKQNLKAPIMEEENNNVAIILDSEGVITKKPRRGRPKRNLAKAKKIEKSETLQVEELKVQAINEENNNVAKQLELPFNETKFHQSGKNESFEVQPLVGEKIDEQNNVDGGVAIEGRKLKDSVKKVAAVAKDLTDKNNDESEDGILETREKEITKDNITKRRWKKRKVICSSDESDKENLETSHSSLIRAAASSKVGPELYVKVSKIECGGYKRLKSKQVEKPAKKLIPERVPSSNEQGVELANEDVEHGDNKSVEDKNEQPLTIPLKTLSVENAANVGLDTDIGSQKNTNFLFEEQDEIGGKNLENVVRLDKANDEIRESHDVQDVIQCLDGDQEAENDFDVIKKSWNRSVQVAQHENNLRNVAIELEKEPDENQKSYANQTLSTTLGGKRKRLLYNPQDLSYWQDSIQKDVDDPVPELGNAAEDFDETVVKKTKLRKPKDKPIKTIAKNKEVKNRSTKTRKAAKKDPDYTSTKKIKVVNPHFMLDIPKSKRHGSLKPVFHSIMESFRQEMGHSLSDIIEKNTSKIEMSPKARKKSVRHATKRSTKRTYKDRTVRAGEENLSSPQTSLKLRRSTSEEDTPYNSPVKVTKWAVKEGKPKKINIISDIQIRPKQTLEKDNEILNKMCKPGDDINVATYSQETMKLANYMDRLAGKAEVRSVEPLDRQLPIISESITKEEISSWIFTGSPNYKKVTTTFSEGQCVLKHAYPMFNSLLSCGAVGQEREDIKNICSILDKYA